MKKRDLTPGVQISESAYFLNFSRPYTFIYELISTKNRFRLYTKNKKNFLILNSTGIVTRELFWQIVDELEISFLIECGANDASVSRNFTQVNSARKALAIEANPQVYGRYQKVNSEYQQIQYINVGLSNRRKISPFYVPKVTDPSTSIFGSFQKLPIYDYYNPTPVKIEKLDSIVRNFRLKSERIALWIDVEGELGRLIQGARKTLSDYSVKLLYCEVQENNHYNDEKTAMEISQELWSLGFVPVARDFPTAPLYNLIFLRKDMIERVNPLLLSHLEDLQKIKLPFFVVPDYKTPLSRIKKFILRPNSKLWHKMVNSIAAILGSSSSKRENQP